MLSICGGICLKSSGLLVHLHKLVPHFRPQSVPTCAPSPRLTMVDFRYLDEGVRIVGGWYPIMKLRWIEGQSLNRFVAQSLGQPKLLDQLFDLWVKLAARLRTAGIAHADLQHGNVVLVPESASGRLLLKQPIECVQY